MEEKYKPQGHATVPGIFITLAFGILAAFILPFVYIILGRLIPNIWFVAICSALLGMGLAFFIDLGIKINKIRNVKVALAISIFCGLLTFYFQWVIFDALMYSQKGFTFSLTAQDVNVLLKDIFFLFTHPNILLQEIVNLNDVGTFRLKGSENVSGILLWALWAGEFLVIVGAAVFTVLNAQVKKPFSELNNEWMKPRKTVNYIPFVADKEVLFREINNRNYQALAHNQTVLEQPTFAEVVIYESNGDSVKYLTVTNITAAVKKKDEKRKIVFSHFALHNANI